MSTYYVAGLPYSDELYHFGIKGQKWGIRRYQNPDGTLTPAGKERYLRSIDANKVYNDKLEVIRKEREKLFGKSPDLKSQFGYRTAAYRTNAEKDKYDRSIVTKANKLGLNTSKYEKAIADAYEYRKKNSSDINRGYRVERGKKIVDSGKDISSSLMRNISSLLLTKIMKDNFSLALVDSGHEFAGSMVNGVGLALMYRDIVGIGSDIADAIAVSEYKKAKQTGYDNNN